MSAAALLLGSILLCGEPLHVRGDGSVQFSDRQLRGSHSGTRAGFVRWAATAQGRELLRRFNGREYRIVVVEDPDEPSMGRAPQPGMITFLQVNDRAKVKTFELIVNPRAAFVPSDATTLAGQPSSVADFMAAAWAAEMLHIHLYSQGIALPHHEREDFQTAWLEVATQLGFPTMQHGGDSEEGPHVTRVIGRRRGE
jgi:hypothetical protein